MPDNRRQIFEEALRILKPKSAPTLRRVPHPDHGFFHVADNSVSLPVETNLETALHEIRHSLDRGELRKFHELVGRMNAPTTPQEEVRKLIEQAHLTNLRLEARANAGMPQVARDGFNYYKRLMEREMAANGVNPKHIRKKLKAYYAAGGASDVGTQNEAWNKLSSFRPNRLLHFVHGSEEITRSLSELHRTNPELAKRVLDDLIAKGWRSPEYMGMRHNVEDIMRSQLPGLGIAPKHQYPVYSVLNTPNGAFSGERHVTFDPEALQDRLTLSVGDSFPAMLGSVKKSTGERRPFGEFHQKLFNYEQIRQLIDQHGGIENLLKKAPIGRSKTPYIESQIWDTPEALKNMILKTGSVYDSAVQDPATGKWRMTDATGYVRLYDEQPTPRNWMKYQLEHRAVMEQALNRQLAQNEIIHHVDGNRTNNTLDNLKVIEDHLAHIRNEHPEWRRGVTGKMTADQLSALMQSGAGMQIKADAEKRAAVKLAALLKERD